MANRHDGTDRVTGCAVGADEAPIAAPPAARAAAIGTASGAAVVEPSLRPERIVAARAARRPASWAAGG